MCNVQYFNGVVRFNSEIQGYDLLIIGVGPSIKYFLMFALLSLPPDADLN